MKSNITKKIQHMIIRENEDLVKQYFEYFNNHEWVKMANMYAEISEFKDPSLGQGIMKQTRQQIIENLLTDNIYSSNKLLLTTCV